MVRNKKQAQKTLKKHQVFSSDGPAKRHTCLC